MANATQRDSRAGFTIYRESGGGISRDALNDQLVSAGYGPVSDRTVTHYRSLLVAGFDRYISINRFDVARSASRFEDLGASVVDGLDSTGAPISNTSSGDDVTPSACRPPAPADGARKLVAAVPYDQDFNRSDAYMLLDVSSTGALSDTSATFSMRRAFYGTVVFTPAGFVVPEPTTGLSLILGAAVIGGFRRRTRAEATQN